MNFSAARTDVHVSADGAVIAYPLTPDGTVRHSFAALGGGDQSDAGSAGVCPCSRRACPRPASRSSTGRTITRRRSTARRRNSTTTRCRASYAIAPDGRSVLLGTEWAIRRLDLDAKEIWSQNLPAVAWSVNVSRNGEMAVAALSDGTVRWYRMKDGKEILAYFPHGERPGLDGLDAGRLLHLVGQRRQLRRLAPQSRQGSGARLLSRGAVRSDPLPSRRGCRHVPPGVWRARPALRRPCVSATFQIAQLRAIAPPRLRLVPAALQGLADGRPRATLRLEGEKNALDIKDYAVFVNGIPVTPSRDRALSGSETERFSRTVEIDLLRRRTRSGSRPSTACRWAWPKPTSVSPPTCVHRPFAGNLYVLAVGVNVFPKLPANLNLGIRRAGCRGDGAGRWRSEASVITLRPSSRCCPTTNLVKPDREAILSALSVRHSRADRGTRSSSSWPRTGSPIRPATTTSCRGTWSAGTSSPFSVARKGESLVSWTAFFDALRGAAGRRILIVDTCHAGRAEGSFDAHSLHEALGLVDVSADCGVEGRGEVAGVSAGGARAVHLRADERSLAPEADSDGDLARVSPGSLQASPSRSSKSCVTRRAGAQTPQMMVPAGARRPRPCRSRVDSRAGARRHATRARLKRFRFSSWLSLRRFWSRRSRSEPASLGTAEHLYSDLWHRASGVRYAAQHVGARGRRRPVAGRARRRSDGVLDAVVRAGRRRRCAKSVHRSSAIDFLFAITPEDWISKRNLAGTEGLRDYDLAFRQELNHGTVVLVGAVVGAGPASRMDCCSRIRTTCCRCPTPTSCPVSDSRT